MFRLTIANLIESGACRQIEVISAFGISKTCVIRAQRKLRKYGSEEFFIDRRGSRTGGTVLTPKVLERAQSLFDNGLTRKQVAEELQVKYDTLGKAINDGRLKDTFISKCPNTKSERTIIDEKAADGLGTGCTRVVERVFAAFGDNSGASIEFSTCLDVPKGGVLCALPALVSNGLLEGAEQFLGTLKGYYKLYHILLLLAFMALCRIKTVEQIRGYAPGEFGKLMGLDRIPEVRCLRHNIRIKPSKTSINIERYINSPLLNPSNSENLILYDLHGLFCQAYAFFINFFHEGYNRMPAFPGHRFR
nr:hypothetical protein [uncultured Desulfobacter sp.]